MSPAEVAALLQIRQMRERRMQAAAQAARRAEGEATALRAGAEQARAIVMLAARQRREAAYDRLEEGGGLGVLVLQSVAADIAALQVQEARMTVVVRRAVAAEAGRRADAQTADQHHAAAQRGTEALGILAAEMRAAADAAAERAEEAEAEEPRARP